MSDTPRTDELAQGWDEGLAMPSQMLTLACQLERENAALRAELEAQAVVNGKGSEREAKLLAENAALRTALNDFRSLSFIALLAPVPDCRPHYDLVKKHWALLKNKLDREVKT